MNLTRSVGRRRASGRAARRPNGPAEAATPGPGLPAGTALWATMPGWGIVGDLTPPELIESRRLRVLRRLIAVGLVLVVVACGAGYGYASLQRSDADDSLTAAQGRTLALHHDAKHYVGITRIESIVGAVRGQVADVMRNDVDVAALVRRVRTALPTTMSILNLSVTLNIQSDAITTAPTSSSSLDTSGRVPIGTVTISGSGRTLDDLPAYVDALAKLPGVIDAVPSSNNVASGVAQFNLTLTLTDRLFTHQYDATTDPAAGGS